MTIHNCLKHGLQMEPARRGYENFACPECEKESAADAARNTYGKPQARPIQPEEEAAIEAGLEWLEDVVQRYRMKITDKTTEKLVQSLLKIQDSRLPKAVRPEEVEPGTRFRFAGRDPSDRPCLMLQGRERMWWPERADCGPFLFGPDDRIIPIEEDQ